MSDHDPATREPVIVAGAGPAGCTAALLLADFGIPVTLLERRTRPHPLPRAVHLDDEVARTLDRAGVAERFLARSRPGTIRQLAGITMDDRPRLPGHRPYRLIVTPPRGSVIADSGLTPRPVRIDIFPNGRRA